MCGDKYANRGSAMKDSVQGEIDREKDLKEKYKGYTFEVVAMAYSKVAETAVKGLGLAAMPGIEVDQVCFIGQVKRGGV